MGGRGRLYGESAHRRANSMALMAVKGKLMRQGKDVRGLALKEHILSGLPITILGHDPLWSSGSSARIADLRRGVRD